MAPTARPRGRPKKVDNLASSAASSRPTSTRRASGRISKLTEVIHTSGPSTVNDEDDDDESIFDMPKSSKADSKTNGQASLSSLNDPDSSGYSTPVTSAVTTPAIQTNKLATNRRGRGKATMSEPTPAVNAVQRRAALQKSGLSLTSKRKRAASDDENDEEDNTIDAQVARALQEEEDEIAAAGSMNTSGFSASRRGTSRKMQKILPKTDYGSDFEDDVDIDQQVFSPTLPKRPKIVLGSAGSNGVKFASNRKAIIPDSEDSSVLSDLEIDDSEEEDDPDFGESDVDMPDVPAPSKKKAPAKATKPSPRKMLPPPHRTSEPTTSKTTNRTKREDTTLSSVGTESDFAVNDSDLSDIHHFEGESEDDSLDEESDSDAIPTVPGTVAVPSSSRARLARAGRLARIRGESREDRRTRLERERLEKHHPELKTMWKDLEDLPDIGSSKIAQPDSINRELKPFQLEGVAWMKAMEDTEWGGGLLGDEMGMGKTIQAVTLIMSDFPHPKPTLVLIPPVALMQWQQEIADYTNGTLKTFVYHGTNAKTKGITAKELKKYNVILMSYNSLESMYRKQEKGFKRKDGIHKEKSVIHQITFHRAILDEAHNIKQRTSGSAKACFALKADHKWCLSGTPLQNRIGEFFSLVRFLDIKPFACYFCKQCPCSTLNWDMNEDNRCRCCNHSGMQHVSVFNQELLNPIIKFGNKGVGKEAFRKLRLLTDRFMLRRVKRDHSSSMELPAKEIYVNRQFFGEEENDFASSIMNNSNRRFETYVAQGVMLNNYANIFGLIMQMRQVADHPDLILKKNGEGGQNVLVCCICDETAEDAIRSNCRHEFCRECAKNYLNSAESPDCPHCNIGLSIDLEQVEIQQDEQQVKKSSIINRIKMENWTSSSKIETLVHDLYQLRSKNSSCKSIIFSQFTTMLQLVEWRLRRAGITTVMLDGSMTPAQRQASINKFMTDVNVECFLVSLKAGGVALNLTEASKVFIVDPWWNPAAEWQSADRCHRIGQSRPCSITRLCIEDSVESRMVLLQEKKANMINSTINSDESAMESLTAEDMQFLFRGN